MFTFFVLVAVEFGRGHPEIPLKASSASVALKEAEKYIRDALKSGRDILPVRLEKRSVVVVKMYQGTDYMKLLGKA